MYPDDNIQAKIDRYLDGLMNEAERKAFEVEIAADDTLKAEVQLQKEANEIVVMYGEKAAIRHKIESIAAGHGKQKKAGGMVRILRPVMAVAATVLVFLTAYFLLNQPPDNQAIFADNFTPYQDVLTTKGEPTNPIDLLEVQAMNAYNGKEFDQAVDVFKKLNKEEPDNAAYSFYLSISLLSQNKPAEAVHFLEIIAKGNSDFSEQADWYLALAHLANNDTSLAKAVLKHITKSTVHDRKKEAEKLLNELGG